MQICDLEEKLRCGSSFKKHSFINTALGCANEEAVNDHRLLHRGNGDLAGAVREARDQGNAGHGEALMIYWYWTMVPVPKNLC